MLEAGHALLGSKGRGEVLGVRGRVDTRKIVQSEVGHRKFVREISLRLQSPMNDDSITRQDDAMGSV